MKNRSAWRKNNRREVKHTWERYIAIMAIIALGVGFFAGLKVTKTAMVSNLNHYVEEHQMYDLRLISTYGLTKEDVLFFNEQEEMVAEGTVSADFIADMTINGEEKSVVLKAHTITNTINQLALLEGRMPEADNECVLDRGAFTKEILGARVPVSSNNSEDTLKTFRHEEYTVVGLVDSVNYLNYDRGTTNLADGSIYGFMYLPEAGLTTERYSEVMVRFDHSGEVYSKEYEDFIEEKKELLKEELIARAKSQYEEIPKFPGMPGIPEPEVYVLDRYYNSGYANFDNDSTIVDDIAKILPIFFFLVAALVCTTTMTRMVDEQRTQIGTLKALGYSNGAITRKYMFYAGSAAMLGCTLGFVLGTKYFPVAIWNAYSMLYRFSPIEYVFDLQLAIISIIVSLLCSVGVTYLSCKNELQQMPASLIRPKAPKAGKRVFMERIPFLWKRVSFLHKVSIRNILRYKRRFFMTITGIAGCTALIIAALGIRDSIKNVANDQFGSIMIYDYNISFIKGQNEEEIERFYQTYEEDLSDSVFVLTDEAEVVEKNVIKKATIVATDDIDITKMVGFQIDGETVEYPSYKTVIINNKLAEEFDILIGDSITLRISSTETIEVEVSGLFENYVGNYIFMTGETYTGIYQQAPTYKSVYAKTNQENIYSVSAKLLNDPNIAAVTITRDIRHMVDDMMKSLDAVIVLVMACAVALGFVVIYNLNNINITERSREIATLKVIGFYQKETGSYIFRETLTLTIIGALLGLGLGKLLHMFIMNEINVEMMSFKEQIFGISYILAFILTCVITLVVNAMLQKKINRVNMTESLKSVE